MEVVRVAVSVQGNDGGAYRFGDLNYIAGRIWLFNYNSTPIDLSAVWLNHTGRLNIPAVTFDDLIQNPTPQMVEAVQNQYYWLVGSAKTGGIAFSKTSSTSQTCWFWDAGNTTYSAKPVDIIGKMYAYDRVLVQGDETGPNFNMGFIFVDPNTQEYLSGEHLLITPPVPPEIFPTVTPVYVEKYVRELDELKQQSGWSYIGDVTTKPYGIGVNATDSAEIEITVAGIDLPIGVIKSPWYNGDLYQIPQVKWFSGVELVVDDPYEDTSADDNSPEDSGGGGTIHESIDVDFPELPPEMLLNSGIIKVFVPNASDLEAFTNWIYSRPDQIITNLKKIWVNPMESIISLSVVPLVVPTTTAKEVKFCGVGTNIFMDELAHQYITIDCGSPKYDFGTTMPEEYKSFIDYGAFTKVKIYLPFIGIVDLNTDDVMGSAIQVKYNIDVITGECVAYIKATKTKSGKKIKYNSVLYAFNGNILMKCPISSNDYRGLYQSVMGMVQHVAQAVVDPIGGSIGMASDLISPKVSVQRSGSLSGNSGMLGEYTPYLIIERPPVNIPNNNGAYYGYMSNKFLKLGDCKGYTQVLDGSMRVKNTLATDQELQMIKEELEAGVVF